MDNRKLIFIITIAVVVLGAGLWYWQRQGAQNKGAVETAKTISDAVPEIQTNPGEKVPEINPLDRANPFKYINPLR